MSLGKEEKVKCPYCKETYYEFLTYAQYYIYKGKYLVRITSHNKCKRFITGKQSIIPFLGNRINVKLTRETRKQMKKYKIIYW